MRQEFGSLEVRTPGKGLVDITPNVAKWLGRSGLKDGVVHLFIRHTSASLTVQENADPDVLADLETYFEGAVPEGRGLYRHSSEGPDDMPAHIRAALIDVQLTIPFRSGALMLGTWQGIYVFEHRDRPHIRYVVLHAMGE